MEEKLLLGEWRVENKDLLNSGPNHRKFNEVFLVKHHISGIAGVCKLLTKTEKNEHLWPLLRREATWSFEEKGLPHTLAFRETDTGIVLIRNYQQGIPLNQFWMKTGRKKRVELVIQLVEKLVPVFNILRTRQIVHCDIKPSNILVSGTAENFEVSLIDFGMAVSMQQPPERKTLFALGYSAPELILNRLHLIDHTTDLFALGICIWQLFAGKLPLMHANPGIMTNLQITYPLPENNAVPKEIYKVLQQMCFKFPFQRPPHHLPQEEADNFLKEAMSKRFQSLEEVLAALKQPKPQTWFQKLFGK